MKEIWKYIKGYKGRYQVSNLGRVKSFVRNKNGRKITPFICGEYLAFWLTSPGNKRRIMFLHKALLLTFKKNPKNKKEGNHLDGNKLNNALYNLKWATRSENQKHAYLTGLQVGISRPGELSNYRKLNQLQVNKIRKYLTEGLPHRKIAPLFNISIANVSLIRNNKRWIL